MKFDCHNEWVGWGRRTHRSSLPPRRRVHPTSPRLRGTRRPRPTTGTGSALIEFAIGMIPMMVLVMGLLQIITLARARMDTLREARSQAGMLSTLGVDSRTTTDFIQDWDTGADEHHMTADDRSSFADSSRFIRSVVDRSVVDSSDWDIIGEVPASPLYTLHHSGVAASSLNLVQGSDERSVDVLPAVRLLFDSQDSIDVQSSARMSWTKGLQ